MLNAHMETAGEKETRSRSHPSRLNILGSLTMHRDLLESLERIDVLEGENQQLLSALRSLASSNSFQPSEHNHIVEILSKV